MRRLKNKAALTAGASKQISAYATSYFEARTTNRIKKELLLCCYFGKVTLVSVCKSVSDQVKVATLKRTIHKQIENNLASALCANTLSKTARAVFPGKSIQQNNSLWQIRYSFIQKHTD